MAKREGNEMDALLVEWKHRLGLDDWHIVLEQECSPNDMTLTGVQGECERDEVNKCGVIRVLCKKDYAELRDVFGSFDKEIVDILTEMDDGEL